MPGLGRIHVPDERDKGFLIAKKEVPKAVQNERYWNANGWWGDQGDTPQCVGYGWAHWIEDGPVTHKGACPLIPPSTIYEEAQKIDEIPGAHDGTTVRAAAKYLQSAGLIKDYLWGFSLDTLVNAILTQGPVVIGVNWYYDMFEPDSRSIIHVGGELAGGHCLIVDGINVKNELARLKNSWGRTWGHFGFANITFKDLERLIQEDGEVCLAIENKK